jgi:ubiquinone/menaquinone biosynthesis C-methylase UbiE
MSLRWTITAPAYNQLMRGSEEAGLRDWRQGLVSDATGRVLEIGAGTGLNLPHYNGIESLVLTEPQAPMLRRLQRAAHEQAPEAQVLRAPAEDLPFDDDSFDTVVTTLVLCGVDDQPRAIREARRVLRAGGRLLFLEHVRADDPGLARFQDRMNWLNRIVVGCDCNRPTLGTIEAEGFAVSRIEHMTMPKAPKFVRPLIVGSATAPPLTD